MKISLRSIKTLSNSSYKTNRTCGHHIPNSFRTGAPENFELGSGNPDSNVNVYPSTSHPSPRHASYYMYY